MPIRERVKRMVIAVVNETGEKTLRSMSADSYENARLLGQLDSLSMVNLVIGLEEAVKIEFGKNVSLVASGPDESGVNPFNSVGTIIDYISSRLQKQENHI